jgi:hypothetical protein
MLDFGHIVESILISDQRLDWQNIKLRNVVKENLKKRSLHLQRVAKASS